MRLTDINDNYRRGYNDSEVAKALAIQMALPHKKTVIMMPFRKYNSPQHYNNAGVARNFLRRRSISFSLIPEEITIPI